MPDSVDIEKEVRKLLLDLGEGQLCDELMCAIQCEKERDQRISDTLEALLQEVDELILLADELEEDDECIG